MTVGPRHWPTEAPEVAILAGLLCLTMCGQTLFVLFVLIVATQKMAKLPGDLIETVEQRFYGKPRRTEFFEESMEFAS